MSAHSPLNSLNVYSPKMRTVWSSSIFQSPTCSPPNGFPRRVMPLVGRSGGWSTKWKRHDRGALSERENVIVVHWPSNGQKREGRHDCGASVEMKMSASHGASAKKGEWCMIVCQKRRKARYWPQRENRGRDRSAPSNEIVVLWCLAKKGK